MMAHTPKTGPDVIIKDVPAGKVSVHGVVRSYAGEVGSKQIDVIIDIGHHICSFEVVFAVVEPVVGVFQQELIVGC
ncbi:hypothetical protein ES703_50598 [subsurface metagenome]